MKLWRYLGFVHNLLHLNLGFFADNPFMMDFVGVEPHRKSQALFYGRPLSLRGLPVSFYLFHGLKKGFPREWGTSIFQKLLSDVPVPIPVNFKLKFPLKLVLPAIQLIGDTKISIFWLPKPLYDGVCKVFSSTRSLKS